MADRPEGPTAGAARAVVLMALGFGLVAGLLEVAAILAQDAIDPQVTVEMIRTNHHYPWMIPTSTAALFAAVGLALGLVALAWPRAASRSAPYLLGVPMFLGPLLAIRGLYPIVCVLLAVGLAVRLASWVRPDDPRFRRALRGVVPALLALVALIGWTRASRLAAEAPKPASVPTDPKTGGRAPNVLLVVMDTVRADHLSLYGYDRPTTPNLDRWAKKGIMFTGARATAPWTLPSHASMFTGRWPHELTADVVHPLDDAHPTLAGDLAARGFDTGGFVANTYYCNAWYGLDRGFDRYEDFPENVQVNPIEILRSSTLGRKLARKLGYKEAKPGAKKSRKTAGTINRDALAWISGREKEDRPFFAFLNYYDAHDPFEPPDDHAWQFGPGATDPAARLATFGQVHDRQKKDPAGKPLDLVIDAYDECIRYIDAQLGALLDDLDRRGLLDETLVIVTSDHGEHFGDRGLFGHGSSLYRPLIDVPLLILPPRGHRDGIGPDGLRVADPVSLRDLPATVADVLGLDPPFPGRSLARTWQADQSADRSEIASNPPLSEVEHQKKFPPSPHVPASNGPLSSLMDGSLVYIRDSRGREQLFDRATDPDENVDLSGLPARKADLERMRNALDRLTGDGAEVATRPGATRAR